MSLNDQQEVHLLLHFTQSLRSLLHDGNYYTDMTASLSNFVMRWKHFVSTDSNRKLIVPPTFGAISVLLLAHSRSTTSLYFSLWTFWGFHPSCSNWSPAPNCPTSADGGLLSRTQWRRCGMEIKVVFKKVDFVYSKNSFLVVWLDASHHLYCTPQGFTDALNGSTNNPPVGLG